MSIELSEQEQLRRQSLAALRELGIDPYPAARYEVTATAREIAENFDPAKNNFQGIRIAGRIMSRRIMGSASFFELQDHTGRIQVYIRRDDICPEGDPTLYNTVFKKLLDIGDIVGVEGFAFRTNTGELSVHCQKLTLLSKSLRPLPVVKEKDGQTFDAFTDPEIRYRQRYVDLIVNPHVREVFIKRSKIISTMTSRESFTTSSSSARCCCWSATATTSAATYSSESHSSDAPAIFTWLSMTAPALQARRAASGRSKTAHSSGVHGAHEPSKATPF